MKEDAAQGLATFAEYAADIEKIFVEGKFGQLLSTIELAQKHGGWGNDVVDADTDFAPLVVVPDTGVPNGILTQFDIIERGRKLFQHLQPHVYVPGVVPVSDIQLLEAMADLARSVPTLPGQDRNIMKMLAGWRYTASGQGEASLQMFLHRRGFPLPLSKHILSNSRKMIALLATAARPVARCRRRRARGSHAARRRGEQGGRQAARSGGSCTRRSSSAGRRTRRSPTSVPITDNLARTGRSQRVPGLCVGLVIDLFSVIVVGRAALPGDRRAGCRRPCECLTRCRIPLRGRGVRRLRNFRRCPTPAAGAST